MLRHKYGFHKGKVARPDWNSENRKIEGCPSVIQDRRRFAQGGLGMHCEFIGGQPSTNTFRNFSSERSMLKRQNFSYDLSL